MNIQSIQLSSNPQSTLTAYSLDTTKRMKNISTRPAVLILPGEGIAIHRTGRQNL
ncbi:hypothetical protein ACPJHQ_08755 [Rossellomorea sp. H39__3]